MSGAEVLLTPSSTPEDVLQGRARWCVVEGDALSLLASLPDGCVDGVVTDPPYSSGGLHKGDRAKSTDAKYTGSEYQGRRPDFAGDARDQRSWGYWSTLWLGEALRVAREDARLVAFSDWRQLPTITDAVQAGGWIWRGIVPWNKGEGSRPIPGGFRGQCEYAVWATNGPLPPPVAGVTILPGFLQAAVTQDDKHHQTGKPVSIMRELVRVVRRDGVVLDPFAGSGSTGVAALLEGRRVILCERVAEYAAIARARLADAAEVLPPPRGLQLSLGGAQ